MAKQDFRLGDSVVRPTRNILESGSGDVRISPKSMAVLLRLADARGKVVTRNELFDAVWPGQSVSEDVLTQSISEIRKALGDTARESKYVETVPKRGFRLVVDVLPAGADKRIRVPTIPKWPLAAAAIIALATTLTWLSQGGDKAETGLTVSVAVLPFVDLGPNDDQAYFADGLTEELITRLMRVDGLRVSGRASSFQFKERQTDLQSIGRRLGVSHVLDGSVRRSGDLLRVTARLTNVQTGFHEWSTSYDRALADVFAIQDEIARAVADTLSVGLNVGEQAEDPAGTRNIAAYDAYLAGHAARQDGSPASIIEAVQHYRRATELDPEFALAYAMQAQACQEAFFYYGDAYPEDFIAWRDEAIAAAMRLAPGSLMVKAQLAQIEIYRGNLGNAHRLFDAVYARYDDDDRTYSLEYVDLLAKTGFPEQALILTDRIQRWDPLRPRLAIYYGHLFVAQNRAEEALAVLEQEYLEGRFLTFTAMEGLLAALVADRPDEIRKWLTRGVENMPPGFVANNIHLEMLESFEDRERALRWLHGAFDHCLPCDFWFINWGGYFGDDELVLRAMRRSHDLWAFWTPLAASARRHADFKDILREAGLIDYWNEFGWGEFCSPSGGDELNCR